MVEVKNTRALLTCVKDIVQLVIIFHEWSLSWKKEYSFFISPENEKLRKITKGSMNRPFGDSCQ